MAPRVADGRRENGTIPTS